MKKILKNLGIAVVVFVLVLLVGVLVWEYSSEWRARKSDEYLAKSEVYVQQGDSQALWEIEKAYWMGMEYKEFRIERAIMLMQLNDMRANEEIDYLVKNNLGNDDFYYLYADKLYREGDLKESEKYFLKISGDLTEKFDIGYKEYLAYFAGLHGDWKSADMYLEGVESEFADRMRLAVAVLMDEQDKIVSKKYKADILEKVEGLEYVNTDYYILNVAELLIDLDLSSWARVLLENTNWEGEVDRDLYLVYGRSLVKDNNCTEALKYFLEAEKIDSVSGEVHEGLKQVYECLGEGEWEEWEKLKVEGL